MAVFALFMIAATAVTGLGRGRLAAAMAGTTLVVSVAAGALLVPRLGRSGAALGALAGASVGLAWAGGTLARGLGARLRGGTLARAAVAAGVAWAGARFLPSGGALWTVGKFSLLFAVYGGVLTLLREWTDEDRWRARAVLGRVAPRPAEAARA
jgi:O-antigen/teichoic acid export membrane protein